MRAAAVLAAAAIAVAVTALTAQKAPEIFTATASVRSGAAAASAPVVVSITRYATAAEREAVMDAARRGGAAIRGVLTGFTDAGFVQLGPRRTPIKFVGERPTASGRLLTVLTADPILHLGAGVPAAKPRSDGEVGVALLTLEGTGGIGELAPAATVSVDDEGALLIEDYGHTVIWLNGLTRAQ